MVLVGICIIGVLATGIIVNQGWLIVLAGLLIPIAHGWSILGISCFTDGKESVKDFKQIECSMKVC